MPDMMFQALDPTGLNETAEQVRAMVQETKSDIEAELDSLDYAQPDGIYPEMTVGAVIGADETSQWAERESTGSGAATVRSVQGATVVWNQLSPDARFSADVSGISVVSENGAVTISGTNTSDTTQYIGVSSRTFSLTNGHKYLLRGGISASTQAPRIAIDSGGALPNGVYTTTGIITTCTADKADPRNLLVVDAGYAFAEPITCYPQLFDLTAMFGSGNEPSTVAEFESMYPADYYPYSAPTLKPVQIEGIASTDANGDALDGVEWETQTLRAAGSVADMLYSDHVDVRVGVVDLSTLTWTVTTNYFYAAIQDKRVGVVANAENHLACAALSVSSIVVSSGNLPDNSITEGYGANSSLVIAKASAYTTAADFKAAMNGALLFYELATPTTTPISPALPMTYRVEQGGTESIVVPEGEISAAPILTIAEPVNMGTELARIWAAIEALQSNRGSALGSVRSDSDVSSTEVKEAPTMDEKQTTERESEV